MFIRRASMAAVSGRALMNGWTTSGNRWAEKKTPDTIHIGIITVFIRPEAASMVRARDAINNPRALKDNEPSTHSSARSRNDPRRGTPARSAPGQLPGIVQLDRLAQQRQHRQAFA